MTPKPAPIPHVGNSTNVIQKRITEEELPKSDSSSHDDSGPSSAGSSARSSLDRSRDSSSSSDEIAQRKKAKYQSGVDEHIIASLKRSKELSGSSPGKPRSNTITNDSPKPDDHLTKSQKGVRAMLTLSLGQVHSVPSGSSVSARVSSVNNKKKLPRSPRERPDHGKKDSED
jgi:hypothetical protein